MEPSRLQQNQTTNIISPTSTSSHITEFTTDKVLQHRPIFIKTEPIECDNLSDYSLDTRNGFINNHSITPIIAVVPNVEPNSLENRNSDSKFIDEFMNLNNSQEENKHTVVNPLNVRNKAQPRQTRKTRGVAKKNLEKKIISEKKFRKSRTNEINYCEKRNNKPKFNIVYKNEKNLKDAKKSV